MTIVALDRGANILVQCLKGQHCTIFHYENKFFFSIFIFKLRLCIISVNFKSFVYLPIPKRDNVSVPYIFAQPGMWYVRWIVFLSTLFRWRSRAHMWQHFPRQHSFISNGNIMLLIALYNILQIPCTSCIHIMLVNTCYFHTIGNLLYVIPVLELFNPCYVNFAFISKLSYKLIHPS